MTESLHQTKPDAPPPPAPPPQKKQKKRKKERKKEKQIKLKARRGGGGGGGGKPLEAQEAHNPYRVQELCERRGGRPGLHVRNTVIVCTVSVDVRQH